MEKLNIQEIEKDALNSDQGSSWSMVRTLQFTSGFATKGL